MPATLVVDRYGRRIEPDDGIVPDGGRVVVPFQFMDSRSAPVRAFSDGLLHRPGYAAAALGDGFPTNDERSQRAREAWIKKMSEAWKGMAYAKQHRPRPGLPGAEDSADLDASERAYQKHKAKLQDMWCGQAEAAQDDDYDDNASMGIQRADAPDDIQQMSLARQNAYVEAFNRHMEESADDGFEEADQAAREAVEALGPQDSLADSAIHLERVRDRIHEAQKRRLSEAWRQR